MDTKQDPGWVSLDAQERLEAAVVVAITAYKARKMVKIEQPHSPASDPERVRFLGIPDAPLGRVAKINPSGSVIVLFSPVHLLRYFLSVGIVEATFDGK